MPSPWFDTGGGLNDSARIYVLLQILKLLQVLSLVLACRSWHTSFDWSLNGAYFIDFVIRRK